MCWPRVGEANPLFSVYIALWRSTALAIIYNVVGRQRNLGLRGGVLNKTLCDKVCQWLVAGLWFSQGTPVSSTNITYYAVDSSANNKSQHELWHCLCLFVFGFNNHFLQKASLKISQILFKWSFYYKVS